MAEETRKLHSDPSAASDDAKTIAYKKGSAAEGSAEKNAAGALPESSRIGRFVVIRKLGEGGMGVVYAAYDEELDRKVAVKLLHARKDSSEARARLAREAQAMARLSHPNVVAIYEVGDFAGQVFVAMEFVPGQTLRAYVRSEGRSRREIIAIYLQAARGLAAAHHAGLVHRDFKPDNVIVGDDDRARVLDFGLARFIGERDVIGARVGPESQPAPHDGSALVTPITQDGTVMGTPAFMAPEQFAGDAVTEHSDQFSFCVAFYAAFYGVHPFAAENVSEMLLNVLSSSIAQPPKDANVAPWLQRALVRGMAVKIEERWPSMDQLIAAIERGIAEDPELNLLALKRQRVMVIAPLAGVTVTTTVVLVVFGKFEISTSKTALMAGASSSVLFLSVIILARRTLFSAPNRMLTVSLLVSIAMLMTHRTIGVLLDAPVPYTLAGDLLLMTAAMGVVAATVDRGLWVVPALFVGSAIGIGLCPAHAVLIFGVSTAVAMIVLLLLFLRRAGA